MQKGRVGFRTILQRANQLLIEDSFICHKQAVDLWTDIEAFLPNNLLDWVNVVLQPRELFSLLKLQHLRKTFEKRRQSHNRVFVNKELIRRADFFEHATKFPLDEAQRRAVVTDEDNNLVVAGAGSGKTLTIVGKIKYLVDILGVSAEQILPISFTHKSAEEMKHRIGVPGVEPQTFHKFGLNVIRQVQGSVGIVSEANDEVIFRRFLQEMIDTDPQFLDRLNNFLLYYFKIPKSQFEFKTLGDYIQYLKDQNFTTLKQIAKKYTQKQQSRQTLKNEIVKSIEECQIANFLTLNRVEYQYEQLYRPSLGSSQSTKQQTPFQGNYKPDFTIITDEGKVIYLEHFGMDKQGNVPSFFARPGETRAQAAARYQSSYRWKKKIHHQYQTDMIETYSHQFDDGVLFEHLQQELTRLGVKLKPLTPFEKWQLIQKTSADQVDALISLIKTFLALLKSNNYTIDQIKKINQQKKQLGFLRKRADLFLDLFVPIYTKYQDQLRELNAIDFSDMINQAAHYIATGQYSCSCPFRYVIVDEFQDLSFGRYQILQAIRQQNPNVKFYCVGDDWQSIFRFTGSDITLFSQFERYFGVTALSRIETTYRFNQPLIGLSSDFILKNPHQLAKKLIAPAGKESTTYKIVESLADDDTEAVIQVVKQLLDNGAKPEESFYLIGRYNFDFQRRIMERNHRLKVNYQQSNAIYLITAGQFKGQQIKLQFITAHKSKGLEADYVIVINCNSGKYGFPSGKSDDPVLSLVLSSGDQFTDGEERRLFYVAMTRAKKAVVFVTNKYRKSKFIKELEPLLGQSCDQEAIRCPRCGHGEVVKRSGPFSDFYSCTNWEYGCDYRSKQPPKL